MKKFYKTNTFLAVLSVIASITIWIYVVYEVNPMYERWIKDVPVECTNVSSLFSEGKMIITGENNNLINGNYTIDVKIKGKRNAVSSIDRSDIHCTLDMVTVTKSGSYNFKPVIDIENSGIEIQRSDPNNIKFTVEEIIQKDIQIELVKSGNPGSGYTIEDVVNNNSQVKITAPKSVVDNVRNAKVFLDIGSLDVKSTQTSCPIVFYDRDGKEIDSPKFTTNIGHAAIKYNFYTQKDVTVKFLPRYKNEITKNYNGTPVTLSILENNRYSGADGVEMKVKLKGPVTSLEAFEKNKRNVYTEDIDVTEIYYDKIFENVKAAELSNNVTYVNVPTFTVRATVNNG